MYIVCMYCKSCISFFFVQFLNFFYNLHDLPQKKKDYTHLLQKKNHSIFFIIYMICREKKLHAFTAKKNYTN